MSAYRTAADVHVTLSDCLSKSELLGLEAQVERCVKLTGEPPVYVNMTRWTFDRLTRREPNCQASVLLCGIDIPIKFRENMASDLIQLWGK